MTRISKAANRISSKARRAIPAFAAIALFATTLPLAVAAPSAGQATEAKGRGARPTAAGGASTSQGLKAVERGLTFVEEQEAKLGRKSDASAAASLDQQRLNLETTRQILEYREKRPANTTSDILGTARLAMIRQAATMGIELPAGGEDVPELSPSEAALELVARYEIAPSEAEKKSIAALDHLSHPVKTALGIYMSAFLRFDQSIRESLGEFGSARAEQLRKQMEQALSEDPSGGSAAFGVVATGQLPDLDRILSARLSMLLAAETLAIALEDNPTNFKGGPAKPFDTVPPKISGSRAGKAPGRADVPADEGKTAKSAPTSKEQTPPLETNPSGFPDTPVKPPGPAGPPPAGIPSPPVPLKVATHGAPHECEYEVILALCIDLDQNAEPNATAANNIYKSNYALQIDAGGDDCYLNNAGGNGVLLAPTSLNDCGEKLTDTIDRTNAFGAAALLDLAGKDQYRTANSVGGNGGGSGGSGFLVDLGASDDVYSAGTPGRPQAFAGGLNGGAHGGRGYPGMGFLLDEGGNDIYQVQAEQSSVSCPGGSCPAWGTNGGAQSGGSGFLLDGGGNDLFSVPGTHVSKGLPCPARVYGGGDGDCWTRGANGGASGGHGFLVDLGGNDTYEAKRAGVNGGAEQLGGGFLLDLAGDDFYTGTTEGVNGGAAGRGLFGSNAGASGFLFDGAGQDTYAAENDGTNGGAGSASFGFLPPVPYGGAGLLLDAGGIDGYTDTSAPERDSIHSGTGRDVTVVPKGRGAQIDQNSPRADLEVDMSDSPDSVPAGSNLTYSVGVTNKGLAPEDRIDQRVPDGSKKCQPNSGSLTSPHGAPFEPCPPPGLHGGRYVAYDVTVTDHLPRDVNFSYADPACAYTEEGHLVVCRLGDLDEGKRATVEIVVSPKRRTEDRWQIRNKVTVASSPARHARSTPDPNSENNAAEETTTVTKAVPVPAISVSDAPPVQEGPAGAESAASFSISLSGPPSDSPVSVSYATADGTAAVSDKDYSPRTGRVEFKPGLTDQTITVPVQIMGDDISEPDETFNLKLSKPDNAIVDKGQAKATIADDDPLPAVSIDDVEVKEAPFGSLSFAEFNVSLSSRSGQVVSADYSTSDGTATEDDQDYHARAGTLDFPPGEVARTVRVAVISDGAAESEETFAVKLSNAQKAVFGKSEGIATILANEGTQETIDANSYTYEDSERGAGGVFVSGHDAELHSSGGSIAAQRIIQRAVGYVTRDKPSPRMLYITGDGISSDGVSAPPCDPNGTWTGQQPGVQHPCRPDMEGLPITAATGAAGMRLAGFLEFDMARAGGGRNYKDLSTVDFSQYDVVVVSCYMDWGNLSQAEVDILKDRTEDVLRYVNGGGGLVAFEESGLARQFGFLPFLRSAASHHQSEVGFRATTFGKSLGLSDQDVSANISHNVFTDSRGFGVVDVDGAGRPISLATRRYLDERGAVSDDSLDQAASGEDQSSLNGPFRPSQEEDGLPRPATDAALKAAPIFKGEVFHQMPPPAQPIARPEAAGVGRGPLAQQVPQTQAQMQLQGQLQSQHQVQQQAQSQNVMQVQVQAAPVRQQERQAQVQVAKAEAGREQSQESRGPSKAREHLATARQPVSPAGAAIGGISALTLAMLALVRPKKQKMPKAAPAVRTGTRSTALHKPQPRHRKH